MRIQEYYELLLRDLVIVDDFLEIFPYKKCTDEMNTSEFSYPSFF